MRVVMARRRHKSREISTEKESLSERMHELISKATVDERRKAHENAGSETAGERRRRDDETNPEQHDD
jgi:hypothetical protein